MREALGISGGEGCVYGARLQSDGADVITRDLEV